MINMNLRDYDDDVSTVSVSDLDDDSLNEEEELFELEEGSYAERLDLYWGIIEGASWLSLNYTEEQVQKMLERSKCRDLWQLSQFVYFEEILYPYENDLI